MWLGKALFLKGEDRREKALQEYREGVRVLAQSKAERRSPSMALFCWYLGKALLENGEVNVCRDKFGIGPGARAAAETRVSEDRTVCPQNNAPLYLSPLDMHASDCSVCI